MRCALTQGGHNRHDSYTGDFLWFADTSLHEKIMGVNFFGQLSVKHPLLPSMIRSSKDAPGHIL